MRGRAILVGVLSMILLAGCSRSGPYRGQAAFVSGPDPEYPVPFPPQTGLVAWINVEDCADGPDHCLTGPTSDHSNGRLVILGSETRRVIEIGLGGQAVVPLAPETYLVSAIESSNSAKTFRLLCPEVFVGIRAESVRYLSLTCEPGHLPAPS